MFRFEGVAHKDSMANDLWCKGPNLMKLDTLNQWHFLDAHQA